MKTERYYYAVENTRADLQSGNRGFANTWAVGRFKCKTDRDAYVIDNSNKLARAVTRKEAGEVFAACYRCIGRPVPKGGVFHHEREWSPRQGNDWEASGEWT